MDAALQLPDELAPDAAHAEALAQAELDRRTAREVSFRGKAEGDTRLRPGAIVEIAGVEAAFAGRYVLADVTHQIDRESAFTSSLSTRLPALQHENGRGAIATFGTVTQIADPDGLGRVKVSLPTFNDVETDWMGVLTAGAGADKGLLITPDVGDLVLVLCPHADPAGGIVLGGLYGMGGHPDPGVEGNAVKRFTLKTPGGQVLNLDDAGQIVRFDNSDGSFVELAPGMVKLHSNVDLEIEAPGRAVVIRGSTIDFQQG